MCKRQIVILLILTLFASESLSQNSTQDKYLKEIVIRDGQARVTVPMQDATIFSELNRNLSISSVSGMSIEIVLSPLTVDWFIMKKLTYRIIENQDTKGIISAATVSQAKGWDVYPAYDQYVSIMQSFNSTFPDLCHLDTIGESIYGKYVLVLKISDNVNTDEEEPETFYSSTMHGDETGGFILMLRLADYLLTNYPTNEGVRELVDNLEIWINPLANPDGTYRTGNTIVSPVRDNANGYDLNRNFPDPLNPNTIKQPETLDMIKFMRAHHFVLSANFHSGEEVVNYPWDRWYRRHADDDWFYYISRKYADTVHVNSVSGYMMYLDDGVTNGYDWYDITGGRQDFVTYELQGREVTIELDYDYVTPAAELNALWQYNWRSLLGYIENALYGVHGFVKDKESQSPVPARIYITGYDLDSSQVYSDTLSGSFVRFLAPGIYSLLFTANGYIDQTVNVIVYEGQETEISVEMVSFLNPIDTIDTPVLKLYPNPAYKEIRAILPARQYGLVHICIYNISGMKIRDYYEETSENVPVIIDVSNFSRGVYSLLITNTATNCSDRSRFVVVRR